MGARNISIKLHGNSFTCCQDLSLVQSLRFILWEPWVIWSHIKLYKIACESISWGYFSLDQRVDQPIDRHCYALKKWQNTECRVTVYSWNVLLISWKSPRYSLLMRWQWRSHRHSVSTGREADEEGEKREGRGSRRGGERYKRRWNGQTDASTAVQHVSHLPLPHHRPSHSLPSVSLSLT